MNNFIFYVRIGLIRFGIGFRRFRLKRLSRALVNSISYETRGDLSREIAHLMSLNECAERRLKDIEGGA